MVLKYCANDSNCYSITILEAIELRDSFIITNWHFFKRLKFSMTVSLWPMAEEVKA